MINWERFRELEADIGTDDFDEVIQLFLSEVEEVIEKLAGDDVPNSLEQDMHFLKGSALNLGFDVLGEMCSGAEKLAASGQDSDVSLPNIIASYQKSKTAFLAAR